MHHATGPVLLPPRIWVVGPCGSGKSTVAAGLADVLGVPPTHLDEIHWQPGWVEAAPEEERAAVAEVVAGSSWVVDGNYAELRTPHLDRADLIVWLDLPLRVTLPRLLKRGLVRSLRRVECCNGNYESLRLQFFDKESLLLYAIRSDARRRRLLTRQLRGRNHVRLGTARELQDWLDRVSAAA